MFQEGTIVTLFEMLEFSASNFVGSLEKLAALGGMIIGVEVANQITEGPGPEMHAQFKALLDGLIADLDKMSLRLSVNKARRVRVRLEVGDSLLSMAEDFRDLRSRVREELELSAALLLNPEDRSWYDGARDDGFFDRSIVEKFPEAAFDIDEAAKCFALERNAAAIFHSMRIVEVAVLQLEKLLPGSPDPKAHFGSVVDRLEKYIQNTPYCDLSPELKQNLPFLVSILPHLHSVRDAWRNKVSHANGKIIPSESQYTKRVTLNVLNATAGLMRTLAAGV